MIKEDTEKEFVLFLSKNNWGLVEEGKQVTKVLADARWYTVAEQMLSKVFDSALCDLLHFPHWNVPVAIRTPFILTIHDLLLLDFPSLRGTLHSRAVYALKYIVFRFVLSRAISRAETIITPSEFTAASLKKFSPSAAKKVKVISEGIKELPSGPDFLEIAQRGVRKPYLLYVGNAYPHKNLEFLICALQRARERGQDLNLVLAGPEDDFYARLKRNFGHHKFVIFYGGAKDAELDTLYKNAEVFVFPSLQEGFGLPGLEAMAAGTPVLAARAGALPEVYGPAAHYFNPRDIESAVKAIYLIAKDNNLRQELIASGYKQIAKYSWREAAKNTLALYEKTEKKI